MKPYDVILLTESRYEKPTNPNWYVQNILTEDQLVREALERRGLRVARHDWATPDFDWACTQLALFRTTWDYFNYFDKFKAWLDTLEASTQAINPVPQVRWNMDKHYLLDLQAQGIRIPPTAYIHKGDQTTLKKLHEENNWSETVLKPTVSGAGRHTYRLNPENLAEYEAIFQELITREDMMLQPFLHNVPTKGEVALMVIGGKFTHAVLKKAKPGDFRVQDDFGGTVHEYTPSQAEIEFAERTVAACDPMPFYARVDVVWDNEDQLALSELEIIEPEMWYRMHPPAADQLAEAIVSAYF
jgi:glutathione synthase/RimK-type ligase-like ATP-grasp enzyme